MGAYRHPGTLDPIVAGILASALVTWVTFIPCFLFIFLGAPYIEYLRGNKNLTTALSSITAAVVGVVLNLGVWFSLNTLFQEIKEKDVFNLHLLVPNWATINYPTLALTIIAFITYFWLKLDMLKTILVCMVLGFVYFILSNSFSG
jgi:chromate transporter